MPAPHRRTAQYLKRIAELCRQEDVGLVFLVVPRYRDGRLHPEYQSFLEGLGGIVLSFPKPRELYKTRNWYDRGHLNAQGAALFSDWLAEEIDAQLIDSSLFD